MDITKCIALPSNMILTMSPCTHLNLSARILMSHIFENIQLKIRNLSILSASSFNHNLNAKCDQTYLVTDAKKIPQISFQTAISTIKMNFLENQLGHFHFFLPSHDSLLLKERICSPRSNFFSFRADSKSIEDNSKIFVYFSTKTYVVTHQ